MTSSETTEAVTPEIAQIAPDSLIYRTDRMTHMQAFAAIRGEREGLVSAGDLPEWAGKDDDPDGCRWRRDVQAVLERTGAVDAYRRSLLEGAY
ncbi:MAG TPA: hypothetical protein VIJ71_07015, partial [Mycobacteriales bacterium]